jgi:hypothetical protein
MAKVFGPLHSDAASGKIADAMVHFGWRGLNVVRQYVIPKNKKSATQGNNRTFMGGTGRACGKIKKNSIFANELTTLKLVVAPDTKQSMMVAYILNHYLTDATAYSTYLHELTSHTAYTAFQAGALAVGLTVFSESYDAVADYDYALGFYLIAKSAIALGFTMTPFTVPLTSWVAAQVSALVTSFTPIA